MTAHAAAPAPAEVVRVHLEAFGSHDLATLLATLAPDAVFTTGSTRVPPAEFAGFFGAALRDLDPTVRITRLIADGPNVACEFLESVVLDGRRQQLRRAAVYVVVDGLIRSVQVYDVRD